MALITRNLVDFPSPLFDGDNLWLLAPGPSVDALCAVHPACVLTVAETCQRKLSRPQLDKAAYLDVLHHHGCHETASLLADHWGFQQQDPDGDDMPRGRRSR